MRRTSSPHQGGQSHQIASSPTERNAGTALPDTSTQCVTLQRHKGWRRSSGEREILP